MQYMREYLQFCGLSSLTFMILDNHFHLVLMVPKAPEQPLSDEELLGRLEGLSGPPGSKFTRQQLTWFLEAGHEEAAAELRRRIVVRMYNLSQFMKL